MPLRPSRIAVCLLWPLLFAVVDGDFNGEMAALRRLQGAILDMIERPLKRYIAVSVSDPQTLDVNLMLGVSVMEGQMMSCTEDSQINYGSSFDRTYMLARMIDELYATFYKRNLADVKTIERILDRKLWTSPGKIVRKSSIGVTPGILNVDFLDNSVDSYFRNVSDECIRQVISSCDVTPECVGPEFSDGFSGYALTHQVLYVHILKRMPCNDNPIFQKVLEILINHKCSEIFNEALYIASDLNILKKYNDLFIEQIAICGVQNMVEFIRPEWLSIVSSRIACNRIEHEDNDSSCESHLTGVSLAALGVYWKFLCYKVNTILGTQYY